MSLDLRVQRIVSAPPESVFDAFTSPEGQLEFYGQDDPGWVVESTCELRIGGIWEVSFGPSPSELYKHQHVFEEIERPRRIRLRTTETRLDGSSFVTGTTFEFEASGEGTLMTMEQTGFETEELRDEHTRGVPNAIARLERSILAARGEQREGEQ